MGRLPLLLALAVIVAGLAPAQTAGTRPAAVPPAVARILRHVPDDTHLLLVVPSLDELARGVAAFGKAAGVDELAGATALGLLREALGACAAGVDTSGGLVVALSAEHDEPLLLLAVTADDESWKQGAAATPHGDAVILEFGDQRCGAVTAGSVGVFAREKAELRRALEAGGGFAAQLPEEVAALLSRRQAVVWVDARAWRPVVQQALGVAAQAIYMGAAAAGPEADAAIQVYKLLFEHLERMAMEARTAAGGLSIAADGVLIEQRTTFAADGVVGRYLAGIRRPQRDLLRGLPAGGAVVCACEWQLPPGARSINEGFAEMMLQLESVKARVPAETLQATLGQWSEMYRAMSGLSCAILPAPGGEGLLVHGLYLSEDRETLRRGLRKSFELYPDYAWSSFPCREVKQERERIGDVEADVFTFRFDEADTRVQPVVQAIYGADPTFYLLPHPEGVAFAMAPRADAGQAAAALLAPGTPRARQDPRAAALLGRFSPDPQFCVLADLGEIVRLAGRLVESMGMPFPARKAGGPELPLAGLTGYLEPAAIRLEVYVPSRPIKALIEEFEDGRGAAEGAY